MPSSTLVISYILRFWTPSAEAASFRSSRPPDESSSSFINFFVRNAKELVCWEHFSILTALWSGDVPFVAATTVHELILYHEHRSGNFQWLFEWNNLSVGACGTRAFTTLLSLETVSTPSGCSYRGSRSYLRSSCRWRRENASFYLACHAFRVLYCTKLALYDRWA